MVHDPRPSTIEASDQVPCESCNMQHAPTNHQIRYSPSADERVGVMPISWSVRNIKLCSNDLWIKISNRIVQTIQSREKIDEQNVWRKKCSNTEHLTLNMQINRSICVATQVRLNAALASRVLVARALRAVVRVHEHGFVLLSYTFCTSLFLLSLPPFRAELDERARVSFLQWVLINTESTHDLSRTTRGWGEGWRRY